VYRGMDKGVVAVYRGMESEGTFSGKCVNSFDSLEDLAF